LFFFGIYTCLYMPRGKIGAKLLRIGYGKTGTVGRGGRVNILQVVFYWLLVGKQV
jgi:hypothetical protein